MRYSIFNQEKHWLLMQYYNMRDLQNKWLNKQFEPFLLIDFSSSLIKSNNSITIKI